MSEFVKKARMVVIGTHDFGLVERVCNKVCELEAGRVSFFGSTDQWVERRRYLLQAA